MGLDELFGGDGLVEDFGDLFDAGLFGFSGPIGEEDVWDFNPEFVVAVEDFEGSLTFGDEAVSVDQDSVDVEDESHVFGRFDFVLGHVLHLTGEEFASGLDGRHARPMRSAICVSY